MSSGSMHFTSSNMFPLTHSVLFQRPYLSIIRNHQKRRKPQFSKLSILTKSSIGSTKVTSNQVKKNKVEKKVSKNSQKKVSTNYGTVKEKKKVINNSCQNRMAKTVKAIEVEKLACSFEPEYFSKQQKNTPISRTVCKRNQIRSISPLYSSMIFNSANQNNSPKPKNKQLQQILDRTFNILSDYKQQCKQLKKQRDYYKKAYLKTNSKLKKMEQRYTNKI